MITTLQHVTADMDCVYWQRLEEFGQESLECGKWSIMGESGEATEV
jgi:hypothetical protein